MEVASRVIYTMIIMPEAYEQLRTLGAVRGVPVLNNIMLLAHDPYPPLSKIVTTDDGMFLLRVDDVNIFYDVIVNTIRIVMIART